MWIYLIWSMPLMDYVHINSILFILLLGYSNSKDGHRMDISLYNNPQNPIISGKTKMPMGRLELPTHALRMRCSTN